ncbi:zinc finger HIT domain-containing protein 2 isoform X2 [Herrania umbratica]|uniref:Zinc finger HIT domain-containing protein 2 isoform X2 n=1 Tax=Herrania umbratica TaxID=108875 RepID=A0A6J1AA60_9ROSI|nr:zinc finger HIT domain-containing protein 2 isoform X2 [Herrania umbratica]
MAETILTSENLSNPSPLNPPSRVICHVCQKQFSQYTCPRCNSRYCSLHCYKSHSLGCTESFMRENVVEELRQLQPDDEIKRKMLEILKRFHSEEETHTVDEDDDDSTLSDETIQKILSGREVSFDDLSLEEKKRFQKAVASGELSKMIEPWDPWWLNPAAGTICLSRDGTRLVQPIANLEASVPPEDDLESNQSSGIPVGPETPLPSLRKLISTEPSPLLAVHLVDIVYSYCFTLRVYNGDWQSDAIGSAMVVLSISCVLGQAGQPETVREALSYCLEQTCSPAYRHIGGLQFGLVLVDDVATLLSLGGPALICMLFDLQRMIQAGEEELKSEKPRKLRKAEIKSKLKLAERKVHFIMCWVHEQPGEAWSSLGAMVKAEKSSFMDYGGSKSFSKMENKAENKGKVLIEEM